ncbi:hypothetical protein D9C73_010821 [Collichthys lucidus]|uniref:Uncharacterized protein n=1 Tax=Collichthys lucidus TaxID=240159 RepID=A0A4U5UQI2_COLLU|nr:hypothetical protein D9C73_010821 [Collichthys lucidus]
MAAENKPEGLKKVRNPDRMYRSAVCYAGHGPPKSISDDTETNRGIRLRGVQPLDYGPIIVITAREI